MKQFRTLLFAVVCLISATSFVNAQTKVAHINTQELISAMPEMKTAQSEMEKIAKTYDADIKAMATELQNKMKQYEAEAATKTDEENSRRIQEVQEKQQNIQQFQLQAEESMQKKQVELLKPITEKAKAAVLKVARAQGFQYVLDSTQGSGVIMADGKNLLADVKKELGI